MGWHESQLNFVETLLIMARQAGILKLTGRIDNLSFYESEGEFFVRLKGGPTGKRVKKAACFERTRENNAEFGRCSQAGKLLRKSIRPYLGAGDTRMYRRLTKVMTEIKNYDGISRRGERTIGKGLERPEAQALLKDFDFNRHAGLKQYLTAAVRVDKQNRIKLKCKRNDAQLIFPQGANTAVLQGAMLCIDFDANKTRIVPYTPIRFEKGKEPDELVLNAVENKVQKEGAGMFVMYLVQLCFYTEAGNGKLIPLLGGKLDALGIVELAQYAGDTCEELYVNKAGELVCGKEQKPFGVFADVDAFEEELFKSVPDGAPG